MKFVAYRINPDDTPPQHRWATIELDDDLAALKDTAAVIKRLEIPAGQQVYLVDTDELPSWMVETSVKKA